MLQFSPPKIISSSKLGEKCSLSIEKNQVLELLEILVCRTNFKNKPIDSRMILYLNDCGCGKQCC